MNIFFFFHHETPSTPVTLQNFCIIFHPFNDDGKNVRLNFFAPPREQKVIIESDDSPPLLLWKFYFRLSNEKWSSRGKWSTFFLFKLYVTLLLLYLCEYLNRITIIGITFNTCEIPFTICQRVFLNNGLR